MILRIAARRLGACLLLSLMPFWVVAQNLVVNELEIAFGQ
jgi:hypothetical protein